MATHFFFASFLYWVLWMFNIASFSYLLHTYYLLYLTILEDIRKWSPVGLLFNIKYISLSRDIEMVWYDQFGQRKNQCVAFEKHTKWLIALIKLIRVQKSHESQRNNFFCVKYSAHGLHTSIHLVAGKSEWLSNWRYPQIPRVQYELVFAFCHNY